MIGIFDSGVGGLNSFSELRRLLPRESLIYLSDSKNAPYGTKSKEALKKIVTENVNLLTDMGACEVLIACCSASAVWSELDESVRRVCSPIIHTAARAAAEATGPQGSVAVIATDFTAGSGIFKSEIHKINPDIEVHEIPAQILVGLVELGAKDGELLPREGEILDGVCSRISALGSDVLILGCTHFSSLKGEISKRLPGVSIINTAVLGARRLAREISENQKE